MVLTRTATRSFSPPLPPLPCNINYINGGNGTSPTLGVLGLQKNTGMQMVGVGYKGFPPATPDLISGHVQFGLVPFGVAAPRVKSGKLRVLAIAATVRSKQFPKPDEPEPNK